MKGFTREARFIFHILLMLLLYLLMVIVMTVISKGVTYANIQSEINTRPEEAIHKEALDIMEQYNGMYISRYQAAVSQHRVDQQFFLKRWNWRLPAIKDIHVDVVPAR